MLDFISKAFKGLFSAIIWISIIAVAIAGFVSLSNSPLIAFLIWIIGLIVIILMAGLVSIIININENIKEQNDLIKHQLGIKTYTPYSQETISKKTLVEKYFKKDTL